MNKWRHSEGKMHDFKILNATDFQYGLSARYTIPMLKTTVSADGTCTSFLQHNTKRMPKAAPKHGTAHYHTTSWRILFFILTRIRKEINMNKQKLFPHYKQYNASHLQTKHTYEICSIRAIFNSILILMKH